MSDVRHSQLSTILLRNLLAIICEINTQVHEIVLAPAGFVDDPFEHGLVDLIGDVSQHDLELVSSGYIA